MPGNAGQSPLSLRDRIRQLEQAADAPVQQPRAPSPSTVTAPLPPASPASHGTRTGAAPSGADEETAQGEGRSGGATRRTPSPPRPQFAQLRALYNQSSPSASSPAKSLKTESVKADPLSAAAPSVRAVALPQVAASSTLTSGAPAVPAKPKPLWAREKHKDAGGAEVEAGRLEEAARVATSVTEDSKEGSVSSTTAKKAPAPPPSRARPVQTLKTSQSASPKPADSAASSRSPSFPLRSATLDAPSPPLAPELPPRRSTLGAPRLPASGSSTSPALPPRPSQFTSASASPSLPARRPDPPPRPGWVPPRSSASPASSRTSSPAPPAATSSTFPSSSARPPLPSKPASQDPLTAPLKPAAATSPAPSLPARKPTLAPASAPGTGSRNPAAARRRYDRVFDACVQAQAGAGKENAERVSAEMVREVWKRSRLEDEVLGRIWCVARLPPYRSCSPFLRGVYADRRLLLVAHREEVRPSQPPLPDPSLSLDRSTFARGMWLIDEELRRRQAQRQSSMRM